MKDNQIIFNIKDGKVKVSFRQPVSIREFLTIVSSGILASMQAIVNHAPENQKITVQEELYDMYNAAASNTLSYFAPNIEMRPHLTTEAILEAENRLLEKGWAAKADAVKKG